MDVVSGLSRLRLRLYVSGVSFLSDKGEKLAPSLLSIIIIVITVVRKTGTVYLILPVFGFPLLVIVALLVPP